MDATVIRVPEDFHMSRELVREVARADIVIRGERRVIKDRWGDSRGRRATREELDAAKDVA